LHDRLAVRGVGFSMGLTNVVALKKPAGLRLLAAGRWPRKKSCS